MSTMSEREFALLVGATHSQVQRRRKMGLLARAASQTRSGHWRIDRAIGLREWADAKGAPDNGTGSREWREARTRREVAMAARAELELARESGELVEAASVEEQLTDVFSACRTKLLGIPTRLRQRLPHLAAGDVAEIEALIREALEELAKWGEGEEGRNGQG